MWLIRNAPPENSWIFDASCWRFVWNVDLLVPIIKENAPLYARTLMKNASSTRLSTLMKCCHALRSHLKTTQISPVSSGHRLNGVLKTDPGRQTAIDKHRAAPTHRLDLPHLLLIHTRDHLDNTRGHWHRMKNMHGDLEMLQWQADHGPNSEHVEAG